MPVGDLAGLSSNKQMTSTSCDGSWHFAWAGRLSEGVQIGPITKLPLAGWQLSYSELASRIFSLMAS